MKTNQFLKAAAFIIAAGAILFFIPFLFFIAGMLLLTIFVIRLFAGNRWRKRYHAHHTHSFMHPFFAGRWQYMNEKDRAAFAKNMEKKFYTIHITANNAKQS